MKVNFGFWKKSVEVSSQDKIPVIFHTYDASYVCLNFFALANLMLKIREKNKESYDESCPIIILFDDRSRQIYNYSPTTLYNKYPNVFIDKNKDNYVGVYSNIDCLPNHQNENIPYDGNQISAYEINALIDFINRNKDRSNFQFDYWIDDYRLNLLWKNHSEALFNILKYCRNLNVIPNGSLQWCKMGYLQEYTRMANNQELLSPNEQLSLWKTIFTKSEYGSQEYKDEFEKFKMSKKEWFIDNVFLVKNYSFDCDWINYFGIHNPRIRFFEHPVDFVYWTEMFQIDKNEFIDDLKQMFGMTSGSVFKQSIKKNYEYFSNDKTNLIFLLTHEWGERKSEFNQTFEKMMIEFSKKYPVEKFNYIFKHHPRKPLNEVINDIEEVCQKTSIKPIIMNNSLPIELVLFIDIEENKNTGKFNLLNPLDFTEPTKDLTKYTGVFAGYNLVSSCFFSIITAFYQSYDNVEWNYLIPNIIPYEANYICDDFVCGFNTTNDKLSPHSYNVNVEYFNLLNDSFSRMDHFLDISKIQKLSSLWKK